MTKLPIIPHTAIERAAEGFAVKPLAETPEAHVAFDRAVKEFSRSQTDWEIFKTHAGRFKTWDRVIFIPFQ